MLNKKIIYQNIINLKSTGIYTLTTDNTDINTNQWGLSILIEYY